jgi:quercetin dioxygenase-like cupin family protein
MANAKAVSAALLLPLALAGAAQAQGAKGSGEGEKKEAVLWPAAEVKWTEAANVKGGQAAVLWGDPKTDAFGQLNRWPGGAEIPLHYHPFELRALVMQGTVTIGVEGAPVKELGPGSYAYLPGKVAHVTTCKPGAECVFLTTSRLRYETRMGSPRK